MLYLLGISHILPSSDEKIEKDCVTLKKRTTFAKVFYHRYVFTQNSTNQ